MVLLALFYLVFEVFVVKAVTMVNGNWRATYLDRSYDFSNNTSLMVNSRIKCVAMASSLEWPNLACIEDTDHHCFLSDVITLPVERTSDDQLYCLTRIDDTACRNEEGEPAATLEGDFRTYYFCEKRTCVDGLFVKPYATSCDSPFENVNILGCVLFVEEEKNWCDARSYCQDRGADLVTVNTLAHHYFFKEYIRTKAWYDDVWIGLVKKEPGGVEYFRFVIDGTQPDHTLWKKIPGLGSVPNCVQADKNFDLKFNDKNCEQSFMFMCQIPVSV